MIDIKNMSEEELKILSKETSAALAKIEEERRIKEEKKKNYKLVVPETTYTFSPHKFYSMMKKVAETNPEFAEKFKEIEKECYSANPHDKNEIYPCPECGEMYLRPGDYGRDSWFPEYKIACDYCDFTAPVELMSEEHDAWDVFHEWLVKEGYLEK